MQDQLRFLPEGQKSTFNSAFRTPHSELSGGSMSRVAVMSIIVEARESADALNTILSEYGEYIIGRMGVPYKEKGISIISVALDAPQDSISALSGKIGKLKGVSVKTAYSSVITDD